MRFQESSEDSLYKLWCKASEFLLDEEMHTSLTAVTLQSNQAQQVVSEPQHIVPPVVRRLNLMWGK